jgi:KaiC/GvpD/RAD55 family RecA-like ATPase
MNDDIKQTKIQKNAFKIALGKGMLLTDSVKNTIKEMGCVYSDLYRAYVCPMDKRLSVAKVFEDWGIKTEFPEIIDPDIHEPQSLRGLKTRLSILEKEAFEEDRCLLMEIEAYDKNLSIFDFEEPPIMVGKSEIQVAREIDFHERLTQVAEKRGEIENLRHSLQSHERAEKLPSPLLKPVGLGAFLKTDIPERPLLLTPWCRQQNTIMIHAWRGVGKTLFSLNIAYAIASGGLFLGWRAPTPKRVLYIDGEMPAIVLQERLSDISRREGVQSQPSDEYFQLLAADMQDNGLPYLDRMEGQLCVQSLVDGADVIVIDNLSTLTCQPENESQSWLSMQQWVLKLRRQGKTVILIHHSGKGGAQRGSSKREDILDVVINLRRPKDYKPEQGARFELHFEKTRGISGKDVIPLEICVDQRDGISHWTHKELDSGWLEKIKELSDLGMTNREIYEELGMSKATFYRYKNLLGR